MTVENFETALGHLEALQELLLEVHESYAPATESQNSFFKETKSGEEVEVTDDFEDLLIRIEDALEDVELSAEIWAEEDF